MSDAFEILKEKGQQQVLRFQEELSEAELAVLKSQIENVDFEMIEAAMSGVVRDSNDVIEPSPVMTVNKIDQERETYRQIGYESLRKGELAAVILAGGQGSRLGHNGPKGTLNVGISKTKYIFEFLLENACRNTEAAGADPMHVYLMTSDVNHEETVTFFEKNEFFGYPREKVHFFRQDMAPALSMDGKMLLGSKYELSLAPNGNGGWFRTMQRAGLVDEMKQLGIKWLNVVSVDNILQDIGDPVFLGGCIKTGNFSGAKVVCKVTPDEKVGANCLRNGHPSVVEYSELSDEMKKARFEDGTYCYGYGVTLNYLFNVEETQAKAQGNLPVHKAIKKITCLDEAGDLIIPETPNAIKMEYFIFDILEFFDSCLFYECVREDEFAPIKNKTGVDSLDTARELYLKKYGQSAL